MNGNAYYRQPFPNNMYVQQHAQMPYHQSHHSINKPLGQLTPYELYMKPAQPIDLLQPNAGASVNQQNVNPQGLLGLFTDSNGQMDFDKMLQSIGQIAGTYHQVSPIVKQLGSFVKMFR